MEVTKNKIKSINDKLELFLQFIEEYNFLNSIFDYISENEENIINNKKEKEKIFAIPKELKKDIQEAIKEINDEQFTKRVKRLLALYDENIEVIKVFRNEYKMATNDIINSVNKKTPNFNK